MKYLALWLISLYRKWISPLKPPCCRFYPTCSAYALEAFNKRGFFVGFALTFWRILRCNPLCRPGYDPVPETGWRKKYPQVPFDRMRENPENNRTDTEPVSESVEQD